MHQAEKVVFQQACFISRTEMRISADLLTNICDLVHNVTTQELLVPILDQNFQDNDLP